MNLLSICYRLLAGKHQVQIRERAICNACEATTLPHQMRFHQFEGQECAGAGWVTITPISADPESAPADSPALEDWMLLPPVGDRSGDRRRVERREGQIGWVIAAVVASVVWVALAGTYAWRTLGGDDSAGRRQDPAQQARDPYQQPSADGTRVEDLKGGMCVKDMSPGNVVEVVDCSQPHAEEVSGRFTLPGATFPGERRAEDLAWRGCDKLFESYVGTPPDESELEPYITLPDKYSWVDSHVVLCTVAAGVGEIITTGSVRSTSR